MVRELVEEPISASTLRHAAPRAGWWIVPMLMAIVAISHINRISISKAGDARIMAQYGIPPTQMGWVYSAFGITYTLCMIPGGWFIDRFGSNRALMTVGFGSAVFVALTGLLGLAIHGATTLFVGLLIVRGLMGIVSAPLHPSCARAISGAVSPAVQARSNGLVNGMALVGIASVPVGFGWLIDRFDWPQAFLIASTLTTAIALAWTLCAPRQIEKPLGPTTNGDLPAAADWLPLFRNRSLILLTLSYGTVGYFQYLFFYWVNHYFEVVLKLPDALSRRYGTILPLAMAVGMPVGGWISDRVERILGTHRGRAVIPVTGMVGGALFLGLGVISHDTAQSVVWFALALGAVGAAEGPFWQTATDLGGPRGGSSGAVFNTGGNAVGFMAPVITPLVGKYYGWGAAVGLGGLVCFLGVLLWLGINPCDRIKGAENET